MEKKKHNHLIDSLSPYLKQHAYNPVDWHEWGNEAFRLAERENKLILVSIGYSACHWCHVMAHECFEDQECAELMNQYFVCIKVDREELPDVDQVYMDACQLVNGSGGWPLNAFALPDKRPIHALTYAPKEQWIQILQTIQNLWVQNPESAFDYAEKMSHGIRNMSLAPALKPNSDFKEGITQNVFESFVDLFDEVYGGSRRAPKFPLPYNWRFLLQYGRLNNSEQSKGMALLTLKQMALGGIYDAVGGGFARYSVDQKWFAPHFEKMLYDNAQLIGLYSYAFSISGDESLKKTAIQSIQFCKKEWLTKGGLYQSAFDADSEGEEGLYYTYTYDELITNLADDVGIFTKYFQCTKEGNWENGRNILFAMDSREKFAKTENLSEQGFNHTIDACLNLLNNFREKRIKPGLDDKCISSWNNLMLKGLSESAIWLEEKVLIREAENLADVILDKFFQDGQLKRIYKNSTLNRDAYLEDYASLCDGLISLYQCSLEEKYLLQAHTICETILTQFYRPEKGFFAFNASDSLISEKFDVSDDVICSGNSIMAHNLWKLSWYFDRAEWREISLNMCKALADSVSKSGPWYSNWAALFLWIENGCVQYVLSADETVKKNLPFRDYYLEPNALFAFAGKESKIPLCLGKEFRGKNLIYPCKDMVCNIPLEYRLD